MARGQAATVAILGETTSLQRLRRREAALTQTIVALAIQYERYDHRRITALVHAEGRCCNHKRVERIWRSEGTGGSRNAGAFG